MGMTKAAMAESLLNELGLNKREARELVGIFAPLYDVSMMLSHLKPSIIDSSSEEYYQAIVDKLARSREPLKETIANLEQEHPSVFGLLDS